MTRRKINLTSYKKLIANGIKPLLDLAPEDMFTTKAGGYALDIWLHCQADYPDFWQQIPEVLQNTVLKAESERKERDIFRNNQSRFNKGLSKAMPIQPSSEILGRRKKSEQERHYRIQICCNKKVFEAVKQLREVNEMSANALLCQLIADFYYKGKVKLKRE